MKVLVSACLLGENCKYNGGNNFSAAVAKFIEGKEVIPVCPEVLAGMPTPRTPMELVNGIATDAHGVVWDAALRRAVAEILAGIDMKEIECAVLQSRSPTCGSKQVYDGTFSRRLIPGAGILAQALMDAGVRVVDAEDL